MIWTLKAQVEKLWGLLSNVVQCLEPYLKTKTKNFKSQTNVYDVFCDG